MEIVIEALLITIIVGLCCYCIGQGINKTLIREINRQKNLNKQILRLLQNEQDKSDTLWRIILHIRRELALLKLKECPEEEFKNIPFEIIGWIDMLEKSTKEVEDEKIKKTDKYQR